jgi:predicted metal-dependent hydrolase
MMETFEVESLVFEVRRSPRRTTLELTVDRAGELVIHAPETSDAKDLARWTRSKLLWVHGKLANKAEVAPRVRQPEFVSGESFSYLGRSYRLKVAHEAKESLRIDGRNFLLSEAYERTPPIILGVGMSHRVRVASWTCALLPPSRSTADGRGL